MLKLFRVAKRVVTDDLNWDFERWYVVFSGNESRLPGHIYDAVELAREYSLQCYSQELEEQCKTYAECMATLEYPDTVDTDLFQRAILHGYVLDGSYTFLD